MSAPVNAKPLVELEMVAGATAPAVVIVKLADAESPEAPVAVIVAGPAGALDGMTTADERSPLPSAVVEPSVVGSLIVIVIDSPAKNPVQVMTTVPPAGDVEVLSVHEATLGVGVEP
jgi:hypothetical protein